MATGANAQPLALEEKKLAAKAVFGGSLAESIVAGATIVISFIAISGTMVEILLPIAVVTMGVAFLIEGRVISMRSTKLLAGAMEENQEKTGFGVWVTVELLGGMAGVVLGILSTLQVSPMILLPVTVIVYGGTLILSSGMMVRLNALEFEETTESRRFKKRFKKIATIIMTAASKVKFFLGLGAIILGIIALGGMHTSSLSLSAVLLVGISGFVTGVTVTARMASLFRIRSI